MTSYTVVVCRQRDCLYYTPEPADPRKCRCTHAEKPFYLNGGHCPLYRLDWQKKLREAGLARNG